MSDKVVFLIHFTLVLFLLPSASMAEHHTKAKDGSVLHEHFKSSYIKNKPNFEIKDYIKITIDHGKILPSGTLKSKGHELEINQRLQQILPNGVQFYIESINDNNDGTIDLSVKTSVPLEQINIYKSSGIKKIEPTLDISVPTVIYGEVDRSTYFLPTGWTKEKGYAEALKQLNSGKEWVKVSAVLNNEKKLKRPEISFSEDYLAFQFDLHIIANGTEYGMGMSSDKSLFWITEDINYEQLNYLYKHSKVVNLVPRFEEEKEVP